MNAFGFRRVAVALIAALLLALPASAAKKKPPPPPPPPERLVIQVSDSDPKKWNLVLKVATDARKEFGEKAQIRVVAFGPGVNMLKADSDVANRVENALGRDIVMVAGASSMKTHNIDEDDLVKRVGVVPSGALEIVKLQRAGYTYLKP